MNEIVLTPMYRREDLVVRGWSGAWISVVVPDQVCPDRWNRQRVHQAEQLPEWIASRAELDAAILAEHGRDMGAVRAEHIAALEASLPEHDAWETAKANGRLEEHKAEYLARLHADYLARHTTEPE